MKKAILLLLTTILLAGCTKDEVNEPEGFQLPPETQTGANTFGCYINGKLLIPRNGSGTFNSPDNGAILWGGYPNSTDYYELDINDYKSEHTAKMLIHMQSIYSLGIGTFNINESNGMSDIDGLNHNYLHCKVFDNATNSYQNYLSFENSGILKITRYDFVNKIISGTFNCTVKNTTNPNDIIEITSGRFDIKWDTIYFKKFP